MSKLHLFVMPVSGQCTTLFMMHSAGHRSRACSLWLSHQSALCVTWASLPCFPAYESVFLSVHLLRALSPSALLSFAFFPPSRPTVPAEAQSQGNMPLHLGQLY